MGVKYSFWGMVIQTLTIVNLLASEGHAQYKSVRETYIDVELKSATVEQAFNKIQEQTEYTFFYKKKNLRSKEVLNKSKGTYPVSELLLEISQKHKLKFRQINNNIAVLRLEESRGVKNQALEVILEDVNISGKITDEDGIGLPGASIIVKGTDTGTTTDIDGNFSFSTPENSVIVVSFIGYDTQEISVAGRSVINVQLVANVSQLEEIVVVGYGGKQRKEDLTGAIAQVTSEDFDKQPVIKLDQALQGRIAGVQVIQGSGVPGAAFKVRVRGANSLNGSNEPLYVVDGLIGASINNLNASDIASINVLKDASATAIYGNQGANGVVIVTTKRGVKGKGNIEFSTFTTRSDVIDKIDLLDAASFATVVNEKRVEQSAPAAFSAAEIADLQSSGGTDYQDELFRTAITRNHQLAFSGGADNVNYYVSANFADQEGIIINSDYKRYALRANIDGKINEKVDINFNLYGSREIGHNNDDGVNQAVDLVKIALTFDPTTPVFDQNGDYNLQSQFGNQSVNPIARALETDFNGYTNTIQSNLGFNYKIIDHLEINVSGGFESRNSTVNGFTPRILGGSGTASSTVRNTLSWQNINRLTYSNQFGASSLSADLVYEVREKEFRLTSASSSNFANEGVGSDNLGLGQDNIMVGTDVSKRTLESIFGRVNYGYDDRYLFTGSVRVDRSSVFPNDPTGVFPSFSVGWKISNESFLSDFSAVSDLKLRGGWGVTGNQEVSTQAAFAALSTGSNSNYLFDDATISTGIGPSTQAENLDLTWEETKQWNIGLDGSILNKKVNFSLDYYSKRTEGLLLSKSLAAFTGLSNKFVNAGTVENKGFEISINAYPIAKDDFSWEFGVNLSSNKSEVIELVDGLDELFLGSAFFTNSGSVSIVKVGEELGSFYGYVYEGVDATGNAMYTDFNDDSMVDGDNDRTIIGSSNPDFIFGFNNTLTYKGFELNAFIQGSVGNDIYNQARLLSYGYSSFARDATTTDILNHWSDTNTDTNIPRLTSSTNDVSSFSIEDGTFVRLKNISLGYYLPASLLDKLNIQSLKVYVSGQNLMTITDYTGFDPEVSSSSDSSNDVDAGVDNGEYPTSKSVTVGLTVKF